MQSGSSTSRTALIFHGPILERAFLSCGVEVIERVLFLIVIKKATKKNLVKRS